MIPPALLNPTPSLAEQLFRAVDCFCRTMAPEACRRRIGSLSIALWVRVRGLERRFGALYARWKAGTLPVARVARKDTSPRPPGSSPGASLPQSGEGARGAGIGPWDPMACDAASMDRARLRPTSVLPRVLGWLHRTLPVSAATLGSGVEAMLWNDPETRAFVAACPQAGRILRPLCRMAAVKAPEWLALPKRVRVRKAYPSPRPSPSRGGGAQRAGLIPLPLREGEGYARRNLIQ